MNPALIPRCACSISPLAKTGSSEGWSSLIKRGLTGPGRFARWVVDPLPTKRERQFGPDVDRELPVSQHPRSAMLLRVTSTSAILYAATLPVSSRVLPEACPDRFATAVGVGLQDMRGRVYAREKASPAEFAARVSASEARHSSAPCHKHRARDSAVPIWSHVTSRFPPIRVTAVPKTLRDHQTRSHVFRRNRTAVLYQQSDDCGTPTRSAGPPNG